MTEYEVDERGRVWFWARADDVGQAVDELPDDVLETAFEAAWARSEQRRPALSIAQLRRHARTWTVIGAELESREVVLPIVEAAKHLDVTPRVLRYRVEQGLMGDAVSRRDGDLALRFEAPERRRLLKVPGPDPRLEPRALA